MTRISGQQLPGTVGYVVSCCKSPTTSELAFIVYTAADLCVFHCCVLQMEDEEDPFVLEDTCILNTDNIDAHSCDTSSLASSDSGDPAYLKRHERTQTKICT